MSLLGEIIIAVVTVIVKELDKKDNQLMLAVRRAGKSALTFNQKQEKKMDDLFEALIDAALEALAEEIFGD